MVDDVLEAPFFPIELVVECLDFPLSLSLFASSTTASMIVRSMADGRSRRTPGLLLVLPLVPPPLLLACDAPNGTVVNHSRNRYLVVEHP